jgi:hypothetical protein
MITEQQHENASLYALGTMSETESRAFEAELRGNTELAGLVRNLLRTADLLAMSRPMTPPPALKEKVLSRIGGKFEQTDTTFTALAGLRFMERAERQDWKPLPIPGAFIKLLSLEKERGYAVLLGKLDAGVRYPAHTNAGPEDIFILTGDLVVGDRKLVAGDFHHADAGSQHEENYSVAGCTLIAVLTTDDPLVAMAMA